MNIYVQNKTAKECGILKEVEQPLDPRVNRLFCWNVVLVDNYSRLLENMDFLAIKNVLTEYTIFVPYFHSTNEDFFKSVEKFIHIGLECLDVDKEVLDNYFKQAGDFKFGLIIDSSLAQSIRLNAIDTYIVLFEKNADKFESQEQACEFVTSERNARDHYLNHDVSYNQIMTNALNDLYENKQQGTKAYELLVTIDVEDYQITRRIIVPAKLSFYDLHTILQEVFQWWNYHLSRFDFYKPGHDELDYQRGLSDFCLDISLDEFKDKSYLMHDYKLSDLMENYDEIYYTYDFGDDWLHHIELLNVYENYLGEAPYLLEAKYSAPPEDVGGVPGFKYYLEAISNPNHEEHDDLKNWRKWKKNLSKKMRTPHKIKV